MPEIWGCIHVLWEMIAVRKSSSSGLAVFGIEQRYHLSTPDGKRNSQFDAGKLFLAQELITIVYMY